METTERGASRKWRANDGYTVRKRSNGRPSSTQSCDNDVYVNRKTDVAAQLNRCRKVMAQERFSELTIHALGAAINVALKMALQLRRESGGNLQLSVNTGTVHLTDDLEPEDEDDDLPADLCMSRTNSAVHVRLFRPPVTNSQ